MDWRALDIFKGIDLNDSLVIDWSLENNRLKFDLIASIWPESDFYYPPKKDEYTCYRNALISFENITSITGLLSKESVKPSTDADGSIDYGNIDTLTVLEDKFELIGDFGKVEINGGALKFEVLE
ncbi:hypothetical protein RI845_02785 [Thalassotalea nanhaiensis]|uniref:Uncharacterized protein n=1 Tax=Thalassotalea nanhaiensis TaxID=3065648 RepID=A0ABY9TJT8_9GAMM|nr:hypothetical protein RI845_02785 [Colwelliaceae bacterium SQ345]